MRYRFGACLLDTDTRELTREGAVIEIEPQVFEVLTHLVGNRERMVSKDELLDSVWGDRFVSESALTTRIKQARQAIGDNGRDQRLLKTVHGRGYRFVADVIETPTPGPSADDDGSIASDRSAVRLQGAGELPRTRYAKSDGAAIAYQVFGEGPPLVLIAGFATNLETQWEHPAIARFLRQLAAFSQVIFLDKRGVGLSERFGGADPPPLETRADDLRGVMAAAGVERATLFGSSEGGALSMLLAATHPEVVDRLVLHGTWGRHPWFGEDRPEPERIERFWGSGGTYRFLAPAFARTRADKEFLARLERQGATPGSARRLQELSMEIDVEPVLGAIVAPTMVIHRTDDVIVPIEHARRLVECIPSARLVELPGTDHWVFSGDTDPIVDAVRAHVVGSSDAAPPGERVLATVVNVEIVEATRAARRLGDRRWAGLLDQFHAAASAAVAEHRGELVATTGDGVVAIFDGPGRAVLGGLALQRAVAPLGLEVRGGIHTAEIERRDADIAGIGVQIARRVAALAPPGQIWVSRTVTDLVAGTGLVFRDRGSHELDGLDTPWTLFEARG
jgi:pimeloyl-ACP methyl ester carboxylesterase/DNA-binding winged helix-turn-helix (wHTH) protein